MAKAEKKEVAVIDFTKFSVAQLPELQGKKEEIKGIIEANPIVEIIDNSTYELAKKSRTAVKTLRTSLEKEQKEVNSRIKKNVLEVIASEYDSLINEVKTDESKRQDPITIWEDKKEQERLEKLRLEELRVKNIKIKIDYFKQTWEGRISTMTFNGIEDLKDEYSVEVSEFDIESLAEYDVLFNDVVVYLDSVFSSKLQTLTEQEQIRIDQENLKIKNSIADWQRNWNNKIIFCTTLKECKCFFAEFEKESSLHCGEFQSVFAEKRSELTELFESRIKMLTEEEKRLVEAKKIAEDNRIASEKLAKEKADFEEKQAEAIKESEFSLKVSKRINELISHGLNFDFQSTYTDGNFFVDVLDIKTYSEEKWDRLIDDIVRVSKEKEISESNIGELSKSNNSTFVELPTIGFNETKELFESKVEDRIFEFEPIASETETISGNQIAQANYHEEDVDVKGIIINDEEVVSENIKFESLSELTWIDIYNEWSINHQTDCLFVEYLEYNFLVPERKKQ